MITYKLAEFIDGEVDECGATVYVVRDGEVVLYVGKAEAGIKERWCYSRHPHITTTGWGWAALSRIGFEIVNNLPRSRDWQIDLYTAEECADRIIQHYPYYGGIRATEYAELVLIQDLRPRLNVANTGY